MATLSALLHAIQESFQAIILEGDFLNVLIDLIPLKNWNHPPLDNHFNHRIKDVILLLNKILNSIINFSIEKSICLSNEIVSRGTLYVV